MILRCPHCQMKVAVQTDGICPHCKGSVLDSSGSGESVRESVPAPAVRVRADVRRERGRMPRAVLLAIVVYAVIILGSFAVISRFQFDVLIAVLFVLASLLVVALVSLVVAPSWAWSFNIFVQVVLVVLASAFGLVVIVSGLSALAGFAVLIAPVSFSVFVTARFVTDERVRNYLGR